MQVGDLVRYKSAYSGKLHTGIGLGIITKTDPSMPDRCHVEWFVCDNGGWWSRSNLEKLNENR